MTVQIFNETEETKNSQIKGERHLLESNKTVTLISKFGNYEREKGERKKIKDMQKEIKDMSATSLPKLVWVDRSNTPGEIAC